jgi:hypothetical protein
MDAYNDADLLVDSGVARTRLFAPLEVSFAPGIRRVVIMRTFGESGSEFDDLSFFPIPEPSATAIAATSLFALPAIRRRRHI